MRVKKRLLQFKLLISCMIILVVPITIVYANHSTGGTGDNSYGACNYTYCYNGSTGNGHGLRMSLYEYDGNNLTYHSSIDFCTGGSCFNGKTAITTSNMAGRVAYQNGKATFGFNISKTLSTGNKKFSCYNGNNCKYQNGVDKEINSFFKLGTGSYSEIQTAINNTFGTSIDDLSDTYITIEPTVYFYKSSTKQYYYGSIYELMRTGSDFSGMNGVIKDDSPKAIMAVVTTDNDDNCFVGTSNCQKSLVSLVSVDDNANRASVVDGVLNSSKGYGINVIWVGSPANTPPKNKTCTDTCSGKSGDDLLGCAEEYCQASSGDSSEKRTCIKSCGYVPTTGGEEPTFSSCSDATKVDGKDTTCDESTNASNTTCTSATTNNYFKTTCTDASTIKYGNSLPVMINPGLGFSYTPTVSGSKSCQMAFESEKWKFDYAASYTDTERNNLLGILNQYNNVSDNSIWVQDIKNIYKYKSNDASIKIQITNNNDLSATKRTTTKELIADKTKNLLDKEIKVSSAGTVNVPLFANGLKTTKTIFGLVKTTSSNETTYKLPGVCINSGDGTLYDMGPSGNCNSINDGPYYEYFSDLKIKDGTYDTKTIVSKTTSNLSVNNTCDYTVDSSNKPVSCSIAITDCFNNQPARAELRIENKNNLNITYGLSGSSYTLNGIKQVNITTGMKNLYGSVGINGRIVATCSKDLSGATCDDGADSGDTSGGTYNCKRDYKPAEYDKIGKYCSSHWMDDVDKYSSEKDCYNSCSSGSNTCKNNSEVDTSNRLSVEAFCSIKKNRDDNGYDKANNSNPLLNEQHNIAMCINDCYSSKSNNNNDDKPCLGIVCGYLYRPISLKDPFPNNREPGDNWYGKEIFITDDLLNPLLNEGSEPEYIIELTPDIIDSINKNTDEYNSGRNKNAYIDYVHEDDDNKNGKYISKFIHSNDEANGGFSRYFSKTLN